MTMLESNDNPLEKIRRNVIRQGKRTTLNLEKVFWDIMDELAREELKTLDEILSEIDDAYNGDESFASVLRSTAMLACQDTDSFAPNELREPSAPFPFSRFHRALQKLKQIK